MVSKNSSSEVFWDRSVYQNLTFFLDKKNVSKYFDNSSEKTSKSNTRAYCHDKGVKEFGAFF